jgi:diguanylate cyclase (GGDEF)-like protein/PAS domain S-box-containing protein
VISPTEREPSRGEAKARLLLVDDDPDCREMVSRRLSRRGFEVETAASGEEGLERIHGSNYDLVLLDHNMPGMTGMELLRLLRATHSSMELPVVMLTAQSDSAHVVKALELGADDYVVKPVDIDVTVARIRTQLSRRRAEAALKESQQRYELAARGTNDGLWDWDLRSGRLYLSERWKEMLGYGPAELSESPEEWLGRIHPDEQAEVRQALEAHWRGETAEFEVEHRLVHADGTWRWMLCRGLAVRDARGEPLRMAGSLTDITESKCTDPLTGLPNRLSFVVRLERCLERYRRDPAKVFAVLFIDLDRFKLINDSLGHLAGDDLLRQVAERLLHSVRQATVARLGGDEFAILLEEIRQPEDAAAVAQRIVDRLSGPYQLEGREIYSTASVGVAVAESAAATVADILRDADTALYRAKSRGRRRFEIFDAAMRLEVIRRLEMESALRFAVERGELELYYQPKVALESGHLLGFEALVRWRHPQKGIIPPSEFIDIAEESGLIIPIGLWVIEEACRRLADWQARYPEAAGLDMSINISAKQLFEPSFIESAAQILQRTGVNPRCVCFELTETVLLENPETVKVLEQLQALGLTISVDDFGTGYSSLGYLSRLPVSGLKIDRSFVAKMLEETKESEIVRSIMTLAAAIGADVVAEGIECEGQVSALRSLGCRIGQGYYFAPPLPRSGAEALLEGVRTGR